MVFTILIGSQLLNLVLISFGGEHHIQQFLRSFDNEMVVFFVVMAILFVLGFVLDFLEIIYIVIPIVGPVIYGGTLDPAWVTIMIAVNLQTSFLTPPFGFALFYLRGVAPPQVTTGTSTAGFCRFVGIQVLGLVLLWLFPGIVTILPAAWLSRPDRELRKEGPCGAPFSSLSLRRAGSGPSGCPTDRATAPRGHRPRRAGPPGTGRPRQRSGPHRVEVGRVEEKAHAVARSAAPSAASCAVTTWLARQDEARAPARGRHGHPALAPLILIGEAGPAEPVHEKPQALVVIGNQKRDERDHSIRAAQVGQVDLRHLLGDRVDRQGMGLVGVVGRIAEPLPFAAEIDLQPLELRLVAHLVRAGHPVAEIDVGQPRLPRERHVVHDHVGARANCASGRGRRRNRRG
jgi:hypothetical protein